ncbi:MAG: efflux RND transporter periplasmic adaptor subunit [Verrucomicrobia bacterium]|nr:MAG: efflux RND transporter periplasmic adaptor subunit [Verrucomicrobiota bacterium]
MLLKKTTFYLAVAGIAGTAIMAARLRGQSPIMAPPIDPSPKPYELSVAASGIVEALSENVAVGVPEAGLVTKVHVKVWDFVKEGQPLFTLDDRELNAQLNVNLANAHVAEATLRRLQDQLARLENVNDRRAVSEEEVRTRQNDVAVAQAQLEAARAQVAQNRVCLARLTVLAPRDGAILQVNIRTGEYASTAPKNPAMVLGDVDHLQVRADIDEQNAARLQKGQKATAYVKGDTTRPIELSFVRIEPYVVPKVSLTGSGNERVDTRVLQVIYSFERPKDRPVYVGQQVDMFVKSDIPAVAARVKPVLQLAQAKGKI